jgi:hypothetical protein
MQIWVSTEAYSHHPRCLVSSRLQQIKIIQVIPVAHDIALDLAAIHPGDMILHIARHQISRIGDDLRPTAHMSLLDIRHGLFQLAPHLRFPFQGREERGTYSLNSLHHPRPNHNNRQPPPTKRRNRNLALNPRQSRPLLTTLLQQPHPPQLIQNLALELLAQRVTVRVQLRELVGELAQRPRERVVGFVVCVVLEVVALPDLVLAVAAVGFVVYEVDFAEESMSLC